MKTLTVYGIPNCDQVRKTRRWLDDRGVEYRFHDVRKDGVNAARIRRWCKAAGWETVLNKKGTSFRKLAEADRKNLNQNTAVKLMQDQPTLIKRPVVEDGEFVMIGFSESTLNRHFGG